MALRIPLCEPPPAPPAGCCDDPPQDPAAPVTPFNPPGLSAIRYRIGTFTSFRRAMLDRVASPDLLPEEGGRRPLNPFAAWHEGTAGDYHTTLIELWAYLADVLTFYQERVANEAYVLTATQRDSLRRLAALLDYRPLPGAGASTLLALTVEPERSVTVPAGFRAGSKPAGGKLPVVFETARAIAALGEHSAIPLSSVAPTNQFARLSSFGSLFAASSFSRAAVEAVARELYGGAAATLARSFTAAIATGTSGSSSGATGGTPPKAGLAPARPLFHRPFTDQATRTVVLEGTSTRLAPGDHVLVVEHEGATNERQTSLQVSRVTVDRASGTTSIAWAVGARPLAEAPGASYQDSDQDPVKLYALRIKAGVFGASAPVWSTLPATLNGTVAGKDGPYKDKDWDDLSSPNAGVPNPDDVDLNVGVTDKLFLDATYDVIRATADAPSWAVLTADGATPTVLHVTDAQPVTKADYAISAKITRLTLRETLPVTTPPRYPLRTTVVLAGSERLTRHDLLPLPDPLAGDTLILSGIYPALEDGQQVVVQGNRYEPGAPASTQVAEPAVLDGPPSLDREHGLTTVRLHAPLAFQYLRVGAVVLANVVAATQGETVKDELLGSGDGSSLQAYPLAQKPLTYLPSSDPQSVSPVQSTLLVTVNGVRWTERRTLLDRGPGDQDYTASQDEDGRTTVQFGDGATGARPPSGRDNVRARYRKGLGTSGNLDGGSVSQLLDSLPGLQRVSNPLPSSGGADPETADQIRSGAPASVRTFGRAVTAEDYANLALFYPGIGKASAAWVLRDPATLQALAHPFVQLTVAATEGGALAGLPTLASGLRAFLDARRDPNVPLRIGDFTPVYVDLAAEIDVEDAYPRQGTLNAVLAAMSPGLNPDGSTGYFAFQRLRFGQSVHLNEVYAGLQAVPGVRDARITTLRRPDRDPAGTVRQDILLRPGELVVVANDPADPANQRGKIAITLGEGGFSDT